MVFTYEANSFRAIMISTYTHKAGQHTQIHAPTFLQHQWKKTSLFSVRPKGVMNDLNEFPKSYLFVFEWKIPIYYLFFQLTIQVFKKKRF